MRQQTAMLYADHLHYANEVDEKDKAKKEELEQLLQANETLQKKLHNMQILVGADDAATKSGSMAPLHNTLKVLTR